MQIFIGKLSCYELKLLDLYVIRIIELAVMILYLDEFLWNLLGIICWLIFFKVHDEMSIIVV